MGVKVVCNSTVSLAFLMAVSSCSVYLSNIDKQKRFAAVEQLVLRRFRPPQNNQRFERYLEQMRLPALHRMPPVLNTPSTCMDHIFPVYSPPQRCGLPNRIRRHQIHTLCPLTSTQKKSEMHLY